MYTNTFLGNLFLWEEERLLVVEAEDEATVEAVTTDWLEDIMMCVLGGEEGGNATSFVNWTNLKIMRLSQSSSEKIDRKTHFAGCTFGIIFCFLAIATID